MRKEFRALLVAVLMSSQLAVSPTTPASPLNQSKNQNEPKSQQELIKEVRHVLVMLPYYSVFDNLVSPTGWKATKWSWRDKPFVRR